MDLDPVQSVFPCSIVSPLDLKPVWTAGVEKTSESQFPNLAPNITVHYGSLLVLMASGMSYV